MLTRKERRQLADAAELIARELEQEGTVRIPRFGRFDAADVLAWSTMDGDGDPDFVSTRIRFRAWTELKARFPRRPICRSGRRAGLLGLGARRGCTLALGHEGVHLDGGEVVP